MWIVTPAQRTALKISASVPASSAGMPQSITVGLTRTRTPVSPRTRPIISLRRGVVRKNSHMSTATQSGIAYRSTEERPAGTAWRARFMIRTPAPIWRMPTERTIGTSERGGRRIRPWRPRIAIIVSRPAISRSAAYWSGGM